MNASVSRVLIVAHRTAATPALLDAVAQRAASGATDFVLLVPNVPLAGRGATDEAVESQIILDLALPLLEGACGHPVTGIVGDANPLTAVADAVHQRGPFDEVLLSTLPRRVSRWLQTGLPSQLVGLGLPVTTITAAGRRVPVPDPQ